MMAGPSIDARRRRSDSRTNRPASCQRLAVACARSASRRRACAARFDRRVRRFDTALAGADRLDRHRLDHQRRGRASGRRSAGGSRPRTPPDRVDVAEGARPAPCRCPGSARARAGAASIASRAHALAAPPRRGGRAELAPAAPRPPRARLRPAAARSRPRASRSGRPGPCRRPTARRPAGARRRASCPAHRPPGRHAGRRRRRSTAACTA